jgi:hypothetical protein
MNRVDSRAWTAQILGSRIETRCGHDCVTLKFPALSYVGTGLVKIRYLTKYL